jgi:hypothetical protein
MRKREQVPASRPIGLERYTPELVWNSWNGVSPSPIPQKPDTEVWFPALQIV